VQTATPSCVVARNDDLFLLYRKWKSFQTRILGFKDGRVEAVVILRGVEISVGWNDIKRHAHTYEMHNHPIVFTWRYLPAFHLSLIVLHTSHSEIAVRMSGIFVAREESQNEKRWPTAGGAFTSSTRFALAR